MTTMQANNLHPIAVSSYCFHRLFRTGSHSLVDDAAALAREAGTQAVEYALGGSLSPPLDAAMAERLAARCMDAGVEPISVAVAAELLHESRDDRETAIRAVMVQLEAAHRMGVSRFRHDATLGPKNGDVGDAAFAAALPILIDACRRIAEHAVELGMRSSVENHGRFIQHADRVLRLIEGVNHPAFGVTLDLGNSLFAQQDPIEAAAKLAPHAINVHVKDFRINPQRSRQHDPAQTAIADSDLWSTYEGGPKVIGCVIGEGDLDIGRCLDAVLTAGYAGPLVVEFEGSSPDPHEGAARGVVALRALLGGSHPKVQRAPHTSEARTE